MRCLAEQTKKEKSIDQFCLVRWKDKGSHIQSTSTTKLASCCQVSHRRMLLQLVGFWLGTTTALICSAPIDRSRNVSSWRRLKRSQCLQTLSDQRPFTGTRKLQAPIDQSRASKPKLTAALYLNSISFTSSLSNARIKSEREATSLWDPVTSLFLSL